MNVVEPFPRGAFLGMNHYHGTTPPHPRLAPINFCYTSRVDSALRWMALPSFFGVVGSTNNAL